ncbi:MAG TPA: hypothetical protein VFK56_10505 [Mycobacterium sp.]|nr:hypothetical protein [Mycobacterium sp.]
MGEIVEVDLTQLRAVANRVVDTAEQIARIPWPGLDPADLQGSAVGNIDAPTLVAARLSEVVADMRGWAVAARTSADVFERTDRRNGEHLGR